MNPGGTLRDLGLPNTHMTATADSNNQYIGALAGEIYGNVNHVYTAGSAVTKGNDRDVTAGLIGDASGADIARHGPTLTL